MFYDPSDYYDRCPLGFHYDGLLHQGPPTKQTNVYISPESLGVLIVILAGHRDLQQNHLWETNLI
jgi:hypothetical protein